LIALRRIRWVEDVANVEENRRHAALWRESLKERRHQEDIDVGGRIIVKLILDNQEGTTLARLLWIR
jgi:hypothetical protein